MLDCSAAEALGRWLARHLLAHVAAQYPHEDVYLIADNNGYEDPTLSIEQLIAFYGRCGFEQTTFLGGMVRRAAI